MLGNYSLRKKMNNKNILKLIKCHAIGDSLLLPYEFLRKDLSIKRFNRIGIKQSLIFNYGMTSDDHDHLIMTYQALKYNESVVDFSISLSRKLRFWILCLPIGIGKTTLFSIIKLWFGFSPSNSGINSSGNGPMMRIPVIASFFANDEEKRNSFIRASTVITHNSNQAISCSLGLGNFISYLYRNKALPKKGELKEILVVENNQVWIDYIDILVDSLYLPLEKFLEKINCSKGVTGYIMHSSVFSVYVLYHHKKEHIFSQIAKAGGDTDTIGAFCASCLSLINTNAVISTDNVKILFLTDNYSNINFWFFLILKNLLLIPIVLTHGIVRIAFKIFY